MRDVLNWLRRQYPEDGGAHTVRQIGKLKDLGDFHALLEDLRRFCHVYDTTVVTHPTPGQTTETNEGRRQAYLHIVALLETRPDEIQQKKERIDARDTDRPADPAE